MPQAPSWLPDLVADESDTATDLAPLGARAHVELDAIGTTEVRPGVQPSSIAPIALDLPTPRASFPSLPAWLPTPTPTSTQQLARAAGVPALSSRVAVIATSVIGMGLIAAAVIVALASSHPSREPAAASAPVRLAPRIAVVHGAREEITFSPLSAPLKACTRRTVVKGAGRSTRLVTVPCAGSVPP